MFIVLLLILFSLFSYFNVIFVHYSSVGVFHMIIIIIKMARLKFIGLFTLSHGSNRNQQGGRVPLMWPAALCSGLAALSCGWAEL